MFLWCRLREPGLGGALLRLLAVLFENLARIGLAGGRYSSVIKRQAGVPGGFLLNPLLFVLAFSPVCDVLRATNAGARAGGVWAGAFWVMDDPTLVTESYDDLKALDMALCEWCLAFRLESGTARGTRAH